MKGLVARACVVTLLLGTAASAVAAQEQLLVSNRGFASVLEVTQRSCEMCHDWAGSHAGLTDPALVTPGAPEASVLYSMVASDAMPLIDPKLTAEEKELLRRWIAAGVPASEEPLLAAAEASAEAPAGDGAAQAAAGGEAPAATPLPSSPKKYLGFSSKVRFHQVSGFSSASLFLAAGVVGTAQWATYITEGHEFREANDIDDYENSPECAAYLAGMWDDPLHVGLRWTHVGLMVSGETLYLANAVTGIGMMTRDRPGLTAADLHRYAFFTHAGLMIAQVAMGFLTTSVLESGNHELMLGYGIAHSVIGLAIPAVMISAGIAVNRGFPKP